MGVLGALSIWSCDTATSIDPPENSFFVKYYGDNGNQEGVDAVLNVDGTITLFGTNEVGGIKQLYFVNIEQNGNVVWESTFDAGKPATAKDLELTSDGRLVVVADLLNAPNEHDILIMTLGLDGSLIDSTKTNFIDKSNNRTDEIAFSVSQAANGFLVAGSTSNLDIKPIGTGPTQPDTRDALSLRYFDDLTLYDTTGLNNWRRALGPGTFDENIRLIQTFDDPDKLPNDPSQYVAFGYSNANSPNFLQNDFYYQILGSTGLPAINRIYADFSPSNEILTDIVFMPPQSGNGFLLVGVSKTSNSTDIFITRLGQFPNPLRPIPFQTLQGSAFQFKKTLAVNLSEFSTDKVSAFPSATSGFLLLANDKSSGIQNFYLTKVDNSGSVVWSNPVIFGGEMDDEVGAVLELPDGSIGIIGTFAIGQDGEKKMTFIKVNKEGKFSK